MTPNTMSRLRSESPDVLFFSPAAWLKLQWFCHKGRTEIGGFGVSAEHNPLYIEEFITIRQRVTAVSVRFEDEALADYFDAQVDRGLEVGQFARIWIHTHPCESPEPSGVDEETFATKFGGCDWAVMFIVGRTGRTYARLAFSAGPGGQMLVPFSVHWADWPETLAKLDPLESLAQRWREEYAANIIRIPDLFPIKPIDAKAARTLEDPDPWDRQRWDIHLDGMLYEPTTQEM